MRELVNHGMDVVAAGPIRLGPRNFMAAAYHALPVAITVEGQHPDPFPYDLRPGRDALPSLPVR